MYNLYYKGYARMNSALRVALKFTTWFGELFALSYNIMSILR